MDAKVHKEAVPRVRRTRVPLQAFLREGVQVDDLPDRARHFAQSAQVYRGGAASPADRRALEACLMVFLKALQGGLVAFGAPARKITLFSTFRYRVDAARTSISLELLPNGETITNFDAGSPMRTFAWVKQINLGAAIVGVNRQSENWIRDRVTRFARRHIDGIALRRAMARALEVSSEALLRARRLVGARHDVIDCPVAWLRTSLRLAPVLDEIQSFAPGILPLIGHLDDLHKRALDPNLLQAVQKQAYRRRMSPADWDRLVKGRPRALWSSLRSGAAVFWIEADEFVAAWCRVHRGLPPEQQLTRAMWLTMLRPNGEGVHDALTLPNDWTASPKLIGSAMAASFAARSNGTHPAFLRDWARVIRWRADFGKGGLVGRPRSFAGALRCAIADERRLSAAAQSSSHQFPPFPLARWTNGAWDAVGLDTPLALVEQAIDQAHCGELLIGDCARGELRVFAVREVGTQRAIGTVALHERDGLWLPNNAKHFANRPPSPALVGFSFELAKAVSRAEGETLQVTPYMRRTFLWRGVY